MLVSVKEWAASEHISIRAANKRIQHHGIPRRSGGKIDDSEANRIFSTHVDIRQQERGTSSKRDAEADDVPKVEGAAWPAGAPQSRPRSTQSGSSASSCACASSRAD